RLLFEARGPNGGRTLTGHSGAMRRLEKEIEAVAHTDLTVLITGETGTGKELVAQAVHARSRRAGRPLITLNCAALPEHLVESELFG
ncbi:MAG TPA: nitric oxide reductase transcription regulator, partial [Gammaproteobacteria bacterium]|nr:nitric oxide reductase transcription regulator [Gammaproteobacteria bacterium]